MKKIIIPILIIFFTFVIYKANDDNLIDYVSIGDSINLGINSYGNYSYGYNDYIKTYLENNELLHKYNSFYSKTDYTIEELLNDIKNNKTILYDDKTYNIKKELREADLLTIAIGMDEFSKILNSKDISNFNNIKPSLDKMISNMDELLNNIKKLSKAEIILIGYYNTNNNYNKDTDKVFAYINDNYRDITKKYSIKYVDIYKLISQDKSYLPNQNDYHLTSKAYLKIASKIIEKIDIDI